MAHVLQNTQNLVISRCCFAGDAKKCTKIYNARAQLLFYSLKLLFDGGFVAVAVVVCLPLRDRVEQSLRRLIPGTTKLHRLNYSFLCFICRVHRKGASCKTRRQRQRQRHQQKVHCNFWYISLLSSAKEQREMTNFQLFLTTGPTTADFSYFYFKFIVVPDLVLR